MTVISQAAGFVALLVALAIAGGELDGRSFGIGVLAGIGGGLGLAAFYKALSLGTMSIVSPIVACGAVVPFAISLATGERPSGLARRRRRGRADGRRARLDRGAPRARARTARARWRSPRSRRVALGLFTYFLGLGQPRGQRALDPRRRARRLALDPARAGGHRTRAPLRMSRRWLWRVAAVGLLDVAANALFALASTHGLLSLVSVLGSLYPVMTVLLAYAILHERLTRVQVAGISIALAGVAALSAG